MLLFSLLLLLLLLLHGNATATPTIITSSSATIAKSMIQRMDKHNNLKQQQLEYEFEVKRFPSHLPSVLSTNQMI